MRLLAVMVALFSGGIAGISCAQDQPVIAGGGVWGNEEVRQYAQRYGPHGPKHDDPFVAAPATPAPAERIVIEQRVYQDNPNAPHGAYWSYDVSKSEMTVRVQESDALDRRAMDVRGLIRLPPRQYAAMRGWTVNGSQLGAEVYSDQRRSFVRQRIFFGFGEVAGATPGSGWPVKSYQHTWPIEPEAGRALAENLALQIVGVTKPWTENEYIICGGEMQFQYCFITGDLLSYRLIDKRDGSVIKEWDVSFASL